MHLEELQLGAGKCEVLFFVPASRHVFHTEIHWLEMTEGKTDLGAFIIHKMIIKL